MGTLAAEITMTKSKRRKLAIVALALAGGVLSGAIHEFGHAGAAKLAGGKVVEVQPWVFVGSPHCRSTGISSDVGQAFVKIAGMGLTVVVGLIGTIAMLVMTGRSSWGKIGVWFFVPMLCQSLAWVLLPLLLILEMDEPKDDIVGFIHHSGWSPFAVLCLGLGLVALNSALLTWIYKRKSANNLLEATA
jgi:membrane-associated protease RseP (regulator of RpoE activity)